MSWSNCSACMSRKMPRSLKGLKKANQAQSNKHKPAFAVSHVVFPCLIIHLPLSFLIVYSALSSLQMTEITAFNANRLHSILTWYSSEINRSLFPKISKPNGDAIVITAFVDLPNQRRACISRSRSCRDQNYGLVLSCLLATSSLQCQSV